MVIFKVLLKPVSFEAITKRLPEPSFTMLAVTPALALFIVSRTPASDELSEEIVIDCAALSGLSVNAPPLYVPNCIVKVPLPSVALVDAKLADLSLCDCASV